MDKLQELENRITKLERGYNLDFLEVLKEDIFIKKSSVVDADITQTTVIGMGGGSVDHIVFPDEWLFVKYKGKSYRIPLYPLDL